MAYHQTGQQAQRIMQECRYSQVQIATTDVSNVASHYSDLKPSKEWYTFENGSRKNMLCLSGTIPVSYKGTVYNIPVAMYLMDSHPAAAPLCYVKPTSSMRVRQGNHVDANGRVYLPYLSDWHQGSHDLTGLVQVMTIVFSEEPPVVSKGPGPSAQRPPYSVTPPYPQGGLAAGYPPRGPPTSTYKQTNLPYPMPGGAQTVYPSNSPSYPNAVYPPYQQVGYPPPVAEQSISPFPSNHGMLSNLGDDMVKTSLKSAVNDKLKRRMKDAQSQTESELSSVKQTEHELKEGQRKLKNIIDRLDAEIKQADHNIGILEDKNTEMEEKMAEMQSKQEELDADDVVLPTTPLYRQILESFAEEQALEDTIYYLGEGLRKSSVDLDCFLKHVRALARQQFALRATIKKARTMAGLANIY